MNSPLIRRVLVVDDEANIVSAVRRELMTPPLGRYRYEVEGFTDAAQALERARQQPFDAVISDYRMPGMDGLRFLNALAGLQPECARLVLSGQTDMRALVKMVNQTHIYRFIPKPWHDYFLKSSLAQAVEFGGVLRESRRLAALVRERGLAAPRLALEDGPDDILVVDGDADAREGLSRILANHSEAGNLFTAIRFEIAHDVGAALRESNLRITPAASGREALKLAEAREFACIVADVRLPDMRGIELLQTFAERQPDCQRILVGDDVAQDELIEAVDGAHIFGFAAKPWHDFELKSCVAQAIGQRRVVLENRMLGEMLDAGGTPA
ncbi:MAG TPA: response regulator [Rhodocyclaceae bacterium]